jgi:hypothetical protein
MPMPWRAREYERTCAHCGCSWRVPRAAAGHRIPGWSGFVGPHGTLRMPDELPEIAAAESVNAAVAAYRRCPDCGATDYTQRPAPA